MSEETKKAEHFDFSTEGGVIKAYERAAELALVPEGVAQSNSLSKAANGPVRLGELKLKYEIFKLKTKGSASRIPLLENGVSGLDRHDVL